MNRDPQLRPTLLLTVEQAAEALNCSRKNVYGLINDGLLPVVPVGRRKGYRIDVRDVQALIDIRKIVLAPPPARVQRSVLKHLRS